jgi:hypothetical protein
MAAVVGVSVVALSAYGAIEERSTNTLLRRGVQASRARAEERHGVAKASSA